LASNFRPTNPVDEYAADRVPVFFDRADLAYLSEHCCCGDAISEEARDTECSTAYSGSESCIVAEMAAVRPAWASFSPS
jgi:hypothetical protein